MKGRKCSNKIVIDLEGGGKEKDERNIRERNEGEMKREKRNKESD